MFDLCTSDDEYVKERPRWVARLSDGTSVYADDERPGREEPSAWVRLKRHCIDQGLSIVGFRMQFRSNVHWFPDHADGYYFGRTANAIAGVDGNPVDLQIDGVRVGYVDGSMVNVHHLTVPALRSLEFEAIPYDPESPHIILKAELRG